MNAVTTLPARIAPASGLLAKGKALVTFYKTGVKSVWGNRKLAAQIRARYGAASGLGLAQSIVENAHLAHIEQKVRAETQPSVSVSRSELLTVLRTERDFYKLPMFCVVFAVFFEMTPIVLWAFPRVAPSTCYSASFRKRRNEEFTKVQGALRAAHADADGSESVFRLPTGTLRQLSRILGFGWPYRFAPASLLRRRMMDHITEVRADDLILRQNRSKIGELVEEEIERALIARNLPLGGGVATLEHWLDEFKEPMDAGLFAKSLRQADT